MIKQIFFGILLITCTSCAYADGWNDIISNGLVGAIREAERSASYGVPYNFDNVKSRIMTSTGNAIVEEIQMRNSSERAREQDYQNWARREEESRLRRDRAIIEENYRTRYEREVASGLRY